MKYNLKKKQDLLNMMCMSRIVVIQCAVSQPPLEIWSNTEIIYYKFNDTYNNIFHCITLR
jgi:hypothetical protein